VAVLQATRSELVALPAAISVVAAEQPAKSDSKSELLAMTVAHSAAALAQVSRRRRFGPSALGRARGAETASPGPGYRELRA
jgi:hypothetical protein